LLLIGAKTKGSFDKVSQVGEEILRTSTHKIVTDWSSRPKQNSCLKLLYFYSYMAKSLSAKSAYSIFNCLRTRKPTCYN